MTNSNKITQGIGVRQILSIVCQLDKKSFEFSSDAESIPYEKYSKLVPKVMAEILR